MVKAAHIVPFFLDMGSFGEILFGQRAQSLQQAGNALLLSERIESWFDKYLLVVVPVNPNETPITRWKTDILSNDIRNELYSDTKVGNDLDGKELIFLNDNRPAARFLYFHFIMALIRGTDLRKHKWEI
ncbi:hypothetical protein F4777DRAFT_381301 [Nemania sp. FL0916]|nr:hypothetical protein F4777DRAFT_381301 [Nemania sp. FL0916]